MCLGVPGKIVAWLDQDPTFGRALVEFAGIRRECHMACVPNAEIGDYVIVHAGIAISRLNEQEAAHTLQNFAELEESVEDFELLSSIRPADRKQSISDTSAEAQAS